MTTNWTAQLFREDVPRLTNYTYNYRQSVIC